MNDFTDDERGVHELFDTFRMEVVRVSRELLTRVERAVETADVTRRSQPSSLFASVVVEAVNILSTVLGVREKPPGEPGDQPPGEQS